MRELLLTPHALRKIKFIHDFSSSEWGEDKARDYVAKLYASFERLTEDPDLGRRYSDTNDIYRIYPSNRHAIINYANDELIVVLSVEHLARNLDKLIHQMESKMSQDIKDLIHSFDSR